MTRATLCVYRLTPHKNKHTKSISPTSTEKKLMDHTWRISTTVTSGLLSMYVPVISGVKTYSVSYWKYEIYSSSFYGLLRSANNKYHYHIEDVYSNFLFNLLQLEIAVSKHILSPTKLKESKPCSPFCSITRSTAPSSDKKCP